MRKLLLPRQLSRPMPYDRPVAATSPLAAALERVGDRWSLLVIEALLDGPRRFGELSDAVTGIAPNILADRLRRLEGERIVRATPYSDRPPRFTYALTDEGHELAGVLRLRADWGSRGSAPVRDARRGPPLVPDLRPLSRRAGGRRAPPRLTRLRQASRQSPRASRAATREPGPACP
jgi:DNA-binding HxlR family transcriptional regulator